ncbi:hypothetical protein [Actinoallomurus acanthiterrae]
MNDFGADLGVTRRRLRERGWAVWHDAPFPARGRPDPRIAAAALTETIRKAS